MNPFETETMADLCWRQGHRAEALAILKRLLARASDEDARQRLTLRIEGLDRPADGTTSASIPLPGVRAQWSGDSLTIEWRLPDNVKAPSLQVLLVKTGPAGVSTERREIAVDDNAGLLTLGAKGLHSARVAAGSRGPGGFVPLARS